MKKIFTIAVTLSALLFVSAGASAQYPGSRNMERRGQVNHERRIVPNDRRPNVQISLSFGSGIGYDRYHGYDRYSRHGRYNSHDRYHRYDRHDRHRRSHSYRRH